ncbi:MAG: aminopeptidase [Spirochaetales bacterium]
MKFTDFQSIDPALQGAAKIAVTESLKVKEGERVLIITNPRSEVSTIAFAVHDAVRDAGGVPLILFQPVKTQLDFCEDAVTAAIATEPEVVISLSAEKLGKDRKAIQEPYKVGEKSYDSTLHYLLHGVKKIRSFWSPGITVDCFLRAVPVNYSKMKEDCNRLKELLDEAVALEIENAQGTKVSVDIALRKAFTDDGDFSLPGTGGNLPAGEAFLSPVVGGTEGVIVFDGTLSTAGGVLRIQTPLRVRVKQGYIVSLEGGEEASILEATLKSAEAKAFELEAAGTLKQGEGERYARNARHLGELGIGVNRQARITGNMLEDEKVYGTCHFAIGSNYDEDAPSLIHLDGLVLSPTLWSISPNGSRELILKEGKFSWE